MKHGEGKSEDRKRDVPSKTRTADGKSFTRLAARSAAMTTDGEGTRSYAKQLFRFRYHAISLVLFTYRTAPFKVEAAGLGTRYMCV
jgi:hypothetical protein